MMLVVPKVLSLVVFSCSLNPQSLPIKQDIISSQILVYQKNNNRTFKIDKVVAENAGYRNYDIVDREDLSKLLIEEITVLQNIYSIYKEMSWFEERM